MSEILNNILKKPVWQESDFNSLTGAEFEDARLLKRLWLELYQPNYFMEFGKTRTIYHILNQQLKSAPSLEKNKPALFAGYQELLTFLRLLIIPIQDGPVLEELFSKHILLGLAKKIDFKERIYHLYLLNDFLPTEVKILRNYILRGLEKNIEKIGSRDIEVNGTRVAPCLNNWLKDYIFLLGFNKMHSTYDQTSYILKSNNTQLLNETEKNILIKIIKIYDYVLTPTLKIDYTIGGDYDFSAKPTLVSNTRKELNDEKIGNDMELSAEPIPGGIRLYFGGAIPPETEEKIMASALPGVSVRISPLEKAASPLNSMAEIQEKISLIQSRHAYDLGQVQASENRISKLYNNDPDKVLSLVFEAYKNNNAEELIACLAILLKTGQMDNLVKEKTAHELFNAEIFSLLAKQNAGLSLKALMNNFSEENPVYLKILLKFMINKVLNNDEQRSAFFASKLENIFAALGRNEYLGLAFYNVETDRFEWAKVIVNDDGSLAME